MIVVHHLNNSRSQRILWMLEEMGLPYEVKRYERDPLTMLAPPELRAIHPLGKSPVIVDGGVTLAESGAIIQYLVERYGGEKFSAPVGSGENLKTMYWLHYAEGSLMPPLLLTLIFSRLPKSPMPFFVKPFAEKIAEQVLDKFVNPQVKMHINYLEAELNKSEWFAGPRFGAADIQLSFPIEAAHARGAVHAAHPKLLGYLSRIHARPAYQQALTRGGPYDVMI